MKNFRACVSLRSTNEKDVLFGCFFLLKCLLLVGTFCTAHCISDPVSNLMERDLFDGTVSTNEGETLANKQKKNCSCFWFHWLVDPLESLAGQ